MEQAVSGSLAVTVLSMFLNKDQKRLHVPSVFWWLVAFGAVVLFTMKMTGGLGLRSLGGAIYGGKKYVFLLFTIAAFVAISAQRVPTGKERK